MDASLEASPRQLAERLRAEGLRRLSLVYEPSRGGYGASHPVSARLAEFLGTDRRDCRQHEAVFLELGRETGVLLAAFLHRTRRGQGQGGVRRWPYARVEDLLRDGLRLSLGMTRKNALAGLWWGGGKGIIAAEAGDSEPDPDFRRAVYRDFGRFVSSLRGCYVTAEDVGTSPEDMAEVFAATRFATCVPTEAGGSGSPAEATAGGVIQAMEAALDFLGLGPLRGKTVAVQGLGNVGVALIRQLLERGAARLVAGDVCSERCSAARDAFAGCPVEVRAVAGDDSELLAEPCDVLAPAALGGVLGPKSIDAIRAPVVCGAANNQLVDEERDGAALAARGILYVPDFLANRMGIVQCSNEQYGSVSRDAAILRHLSRDWPEGIYATTRRVLETARDTGCTPVAAACRLADQLAEQLHPIWGDRGRLIVESLVADGWERG